MKLEKILVFLLFFVTLLAIPFAFLQIQNRIEFFHFDTFSFAWDIRLIFNVISIVFVILGFFKLVKGNSIFVHRLFRFPLLWVLCHNIFWLLTATLSTKFSFFFLSENAGILEYISLISNKLLFIVTLVYFIRTPLVAKPKTIKTVSHTARFKNWIIDLLVIYSFTLSNIRLLMDGFIFDDIQFFNDRTEWLVIYPLFYYFFMELISLQTIGKSHNSSFVKYEGNIIKAIGVRTLCRLIPLEAFSFFGTEGWHDKFSKTEVVKTDQVLIDVINETENPYLQEESSSASTIA